MEYDVLWGDGSLGLTLRPDLGEDMPPVVGRITKSDSAAALANVQVGHMLVSVNETDTARRGYDKTIELLQTIKRPAMLRFRVPRNGRKRQPPNVRDRVSSVSADGATNSSNSRSRSRTRKKREYTVVWSEGSLGMILRPDEEDCHIPSIRKITGKGTGKGMHNARVGDRLISVNGQDSRSMGFRSTVAVLKTHNKPLLLTFRRMRKRSSSRNKSDTSTNATTSSIPTSDHIDAENSDYGVYDIVWREGQLGLKLKPGSRNTPIVSRLTGKGTASGLHNATIGDELVSVSGKNIESYNYQETLRLLKHSPKPAILRFRPGKARRISMMSIQSGTSVRSAPSNLQQIRSIKEEEGEEGEEERVIVPKADVVENEAIHKTSEPKIHSDQENSHPSGTRRKRRHRISRKDVPLDIAKQIVAKEQNLDPHKDAFAGILISEIEDGTREAEIIRVQARKYVSLQAEKRRDPTSSEKKTRVQREKQILAEAVEQFKEQARIYQEKLEEQERDAEKQKILESATKNKPSYLIGMQNNVIAELSNVIADYKRDSYSEAGDTRQSLMNDLQIIMDMDPEEDLKFCAECGASEKEIHLELDEDGEYYCLTCWENFIGAQEAVFAEQEPKVEESHDVEKLEDGVEKVDLRSSSPASSVHRSSQRSLLSNKSEEEQARMEAEEKLKELTELRRSGSTGSIAPRKQRQRSDEDRRRIGEEEFQKALAEEKERLRASGGTRESYRSSGGQSYPSSGHHKGDGSMDEERRMQEDESSSARSFGSYRANSTEERNSNDSDFYREEAAKRDQERFEALERRRFSNYDEEGSDSSSRQEKREHEDPRTPQSSRNGTHSPRSHTSLPLKLGSDRDSQQSAYSYRISREGSEARSNSIMEPRPTDDSFRYTNSDAGSDRDRHDDEVWEMENRNIALAKQLQEAHNVMERVRDSFIASGHDNEWEDSGPYLGVGLSDEQIKLFKKLTSQVEERPSVTESFATMDESDSDSGDSSFATNDEDNKSVSEIDENEDPGVWI